MRRDEKLSHRRRNPEETRRKLMGATVASLFERGYGGLSTVDVARRARVSRGGQLHHFPHKQALLAETVGHLFELRLAEMRAKISGLPAAPPEERLSAFIDGLWSAFKSPTFFAWLEVVVASRTDPAVRQAGATLVGRFRGVGVKMFEDALGPAVAHLRIDYDSLATLVFCYLQAMGINDVALGTDRKPNRLRQARLDGLKTAAALFLRHMIDAAERGAARR